MKKSTKQSDWVSSKEAAEIAFPLNTRQIGRLARRGILSVRKIRGALPHYRRSEIEELIREAERPRREGAAARGA